MRLKKILGAVAATALMVLIGTSTASATIITSPAGTQYGGTIKAELEGESILSSSFIGEVKCKKSTLEGKIESQGVGVTASSKLSTLDFSECNNTVHVLKSGALQIHSKGGGEGAATLSGHETTVVVFGLDCIYNGPAVLLIIRIGGWIFIKVVLSRTGGSAFCGSSAEWSATYKIVTPGSLSVD